MLSFQLQEVVADVRNELQAQLTEFTNEIVNDNTASVLGIVNITSLEAGASEYMYVKSCRTSLPSQKMVTLRNSHSGWSMSKL